jgi:hypothetical protein
MGKENCNAGCIIGLLCRMSIDEVERGNHAIASQGAAEAEAAASCFALHSTLCSGQPAFWQRDEQYHTDEQPEHSFSCTASALAPAAFVTAPQLWQQRMPSTVRR